MKRSSRIFRQRARHAAFVKKVNHVEVRRGELLDWPIETSSDDVQLQAVIMERCAKTGRWHLLRARSGTAERFVCVDLEEAFATVRAAYDVHGVPLRLKRNAR